MASDYMFVWSVYLISALLTCTIFWYFTWNMANKELRNILRVCSACVLFTPYFSDAEQQFIAPALIVGLFDFMEKGINALTAPGMAILLAMFCAVILSLFINLLFGEQ